MNTISQWYNFNYDERLYSYETKNNLILVKKTVL